MITNVSHKTISQLLIDKQDSMRYSVSEVDVKTGIIIFRIKGLDEDAARYILTEVTRGYGRITDDILNRMIDAAQRPASFYSNFLKLPNMASPSTVLIVPDMVERGRVDIKIVSFLENTKHSRNQIEYEFGLNTTLYI